LLGIGAGQAVLDWHTFWAQVARASVPLMDLSSSSNR
jgi:hypothetical protein